MRQGPILAQIPQLKSWLRGYRYPGVKGFTWFIVGIVKKLKILFLIDFKYP